MKQVMQFFRWNPDLKPLKFRGQNPFRCNKDAAETLQFFNKPNLILNAGLPDIMNCLPGNKAYDDEWIILGQAEFIKNCPIGDKIIWVKIGKFVIPVIFHLFFPEISYITRRSQNYISKRKSYHIGQFRMFRVCQADSRDMK